MNDDNQPQQQVSQPIRKRLDDGMVFWGAIIGFVVGTIVWLLRVPKRGKDTRNQIVQVVERDPVKESLEEGKALAAQRRRERNS